MQFTRKLTKQSAINAAKRLTPNIACARVVSKNTKDTVFWLAQNDVVGYDIKKFPF